jgi:hypothetical protein
MCRALPVQVPVLPYAVYAGLGDPGPAGLSAPARGVRAEELLYARALDTMTPART